MPTLEAEARGPDGAVALALDARPSGRDGAWAGTLRRLALALDGVPPLALEAPAAFTLAPAATPLRATLDEACLAGPGAGRLCLDARLPGALRARLADVPLALARPWLALDGLQLEAEGTLSGEADLALDGAGRWGGEATLRASPGRLALDPRGEGDDVAGDDDAAQALLAWSGLDASARLEAGALRAEATLALAGEGRIAARLDAGAGEAGALDGALELDVRDLTFLELLSVDVARPRGRLAGTLTVGGTRARPVLGGDARLLDFAADLPALGITLTEGALSLRQDANGGATLGGTFRSGEGTLTIEGLLAPAAFGGDGEAPLSLQVSGRDFLAADTAELRAVISPDLQVTLGGGALRVRGSVDVPRAAIDIEGLQGGTAASPDVVVLDEPAVEAGGPALDVDVRVTLGEDVALRGFGLDGALAGGLRVRQRPGREARATGTIEVSGEYAAYGSALEITRARLGWANAPLDNPTLDIVATRAFDEQRVGVRVRGTAARAEVAITSDPVIDQTEALSWLVLGRPLSSASGADGERLGAAALALGGAGNLVAQRIGERLGFDQAGISDSRALGGATFTVGKYLSPKLLLSYGVSLLGTGQVVTLTYTLARGFDVQVESGVETSASINWRRER
jgi:translocation and assembly module TamB